MRRMIAPNGPGQQPRKPPAAVPAPTPCRCQDGPLIIATFRRETLVAVERRHWTKDGCQLSTEQVDPAHYTTEATPMKHLHRIWLDNWDTILIWACAMSIALAIGGMIGATVDAVQRLP